MTTDPLPADRFTSVGGAPFVGCGEFNPLSESARDDASRRSVVFVFDAAAEPQGLPCQLRSLGPCKGAGGVDEPASPDPDGKPYRCKIYREVAKTCPCVQGEELMHLEVMLHDRKYDPSPDTHYALTIAAGSRVFGKTDSEGVLHAAVRRGDVSLTVTYQPSTETEPVTITATIIPSAEDETDRAFIQKIRNIGFGTPGDSDSFVIRKFQDAHRKLKRTGKLDDDTKQAVRDLETEKLSDSFDDEPEAAS